jgi:hypothetical protein
MTISPVSKIVPLDGGRYHYLWRMLPDVPVAHQRGEAIADLMDLLRMLGMVLLSEPRASIKHGAKPVMTLTITARYASDSEARTLQHPNDQEETAA